MSIGTNSIRTCDDMKILFLENYKYYYIHHEIREEVFKMTQKEERKPWT